jgi:hypothetical protein
MTDEVRVPGEEFLRARRRVVERNTRLLGTGRDGPIASTVSARTRS